MGNGYGSEGHLHEFPARHPVALDAQIVGIADPKGFGWPDCRYDRNKTWLDVEGLDFPPQLLSERVACEAMWLLAGNVPNRDTVGRVLTGDV